MPLLFSYGTLQDEGVQVATFGRRLEGHADELPGYEMRQEKHRNVRPNGRSDSRVQGTVYEVTEAELRAADAYEADDGYGRIAVVLASGREAWVYRRAG
jgi:gamma-glutamylcyclotransferase (GGCT)/AIG2-like uncharacterized protein YtfP